MTLKEMKTGLEINQRFLDRIDFTPYLESCASVSEVCQELINHNPIPIHDMPRELHGCMFNFMDEYQIVQYLEERYGDKWRFQEELITEHYIFKKSKS